MSLITLGYGAGTSSGSLSGTINLQNNLEQLIAIPVEGKKVKEYFVDRLADKYSLDPEDMIDSCSAFFGSENKFRTYIPGFTESDSVNNFPLVFDDNGNMEITGFWVKIKDLTGLVQDENSIVFDWGE